MVSFAATANPTPFGFFDADAVFASDADKMAVFVRQTLGGTTTSVELSSKDIWSQFERATTEYGAIVNEYQIKSELSNMLGLSTGSNITNRYLHQRLEFLMRQAEPYTQEVGLGGSYDTILGYIDLIDGQQDYNLYNTFKDATGSLYFSNLPTNAQQKLKIMEIMHFSPQAAQHMLLNSANITNFLAQEFSFESYVNSTVFYVLPVFEDIMRRGELALASQVRRSNYSYTLMGPTLRLFPTPVSIITNAMRLYMRIQLAPDPTNPAYHDATIDGISNPANIPYNNIQYSTINSVGRKWIKEYTLCLCKELLGLVRSKIKNIPIPNAELQLNGDELISQAKEDKEKQISQLRELLGDLTYDKLLERDAAKAELINKQMSYIPIRKPIRMQ